MTFDRLYSANLLHITHWMHVPSIMEHGIIKRYSQTVGGMVWLITPDLQAWAIDHVSKRHCWPWASLVAVHVCHIDNLPLPRSNCVVAVPRSIPAEHITGIARIGSSGPMGGRIA